MSESDREHAFFLAVVEALSNDKFMGFVSQWIDNYTLLTGKGFTDWGSGGDENDKKTEGEGGAKTTEALSSYTNTHYAIFKNYQLIFESRLKSTIASNKDSLEKLWRESVSLKGGVGTPSQTSSNMEGSAGVNDLQIKFFELCQHQMSTPSSLSSNSKGWESGVASVSKRVKLAAKGEEQGGEVASTKDLVQTLLLIIETVTDFKSFANMMAARQLEGLNEEEETC